MPMIRPFGFPEFWTIVLAAQWTIALSAIALACGGVGGLLIALVRVSDTKIPRMIAKGFIRLFQGTPLLMQLFLVFFGLNILGFGINPWFAAAIAFTLHASAFLVKSGAAVSKLYRPDSARPQQRLGCDIITACAM